MQKKRCSTCKEILTKNNASMSTIRSGGYCRACKNQDMKERRSGMKKAKPMRKISFASDPWNLIDVTKYVKPVSQSWEQFRRRLFRNLFFSQNPCVDCGETDIRLLSLDHVRGIKKFSPALMWISQPWSEIKRELKKCDVVCHNCHSIRTCERQNHGKWILDIPDNMDIDLSLYTRNQKLALAA